MRKLLFALSILSMSFLTSCDKCKDDPCKNNASCDKKTGDCTCAAFYEGSDCGTEVRTKYNKTYNGEVNIPGVATLPANMTISSADPSPTGQSYDMTVMNDPTTPTKIVVPGKLINNTTMEITRTKIPFTLIPTETEAWVTGTGTFAGDSLTANLSMQGAQSGITITATYKAKK